MQDTANSAANQHNQIPLTCGQTYTTERVGTDQFAIPPQSVATSRIYKKLNDLYSAK